MVRYVHFDLSQDREVALMDVRAKGLQIVKYTVCETMKF